MIMADNGSSMYISGAPDDRWNNDDLHNLGSLKASDFEVVQMNPIYTASNVPHGSAPTIASFTASSTSVSAGQSVTLELEREQRGILDRVSAGRSRARNKRHRYAHRNHNVHALRNERV